MPSTLAVARPIPLSAWLRPSVATPEAHVVPGHNRWHPEIPAVAEVISGGSVRLECQAGEVAVEDVVLCGPVAVVGAEPGDVIVVDVLAVGRADGRYAPGGHPGIVGCAPAAGSLRGHRGEPAGALLGRLRPGGPAYHAVAREAVRSGARDETISGCDAAALTAGARMLLPVHARGAKLSIGSLHFPAGPGAMCDARSAAGWIDVRINLTKRGVERFGISAPTPITGPDHAA